MGELKRDFIDPQTGAAAVNKDGSPKVETVRGQVAHNALFYADEGRQVLAREQRSGTTTFAVLCELWSGSGAGQRNADPAKRRKITAGSYVVGVMMGFQTATIDALFADEAGGAPQRFAYASAEYAPYADNPDEDLDEEWPGELDPDITVAPITVRLAPGQRREVRRDGREKAGGISQAAPLDGHRMLLRCRIAALVALLHGEQEVSEQTWELARVLTNHSCALRDHLAALGQRKAEETRRKRRSEAKADAVEIDERTITAREVKRATEQIVTALSNARDKGEASLPRGRALNGIRSTLRHHREAALARALELRLVEASPDGKRLSLPEDESE
jgi:hypothetical protein